MKTLLFGMTLILLLNVANAAPLHETVAQNFKSIDQTKPICVYLGGAYRPVTKVAFDAVYNASAKSCQSGKARVELFRTTKQSEFVKLKKANFSRRDYEALDKAYIESQVN